jgi:hypothetical protein
MPAILSIRNRLVTVCLDERAGLGEPAGKAKTVAPAVTVAVETSAAAGLQDQGAG